MPQYKNNVCFTKRKQTAPELEVVHQRGSHNKPSYSNTICPRGSRDPVRPAFVPKQGQGMVGGVC